MNINLSSAFRGKSSERWKMTRIYIYAACFRENPYSWANSDERPWRMKVNGESKRRRAFLSRRWSQLNRQCARWARLRRKISRRAICTSSFLSFMIIVTISERIVFIHSRLKEQRFQSAHMTGSVPGVSTVLNENGGKSLASCSGWSVSEERGKDGRAVGGEFSEMSTALTHRGARAAVSWRIQCSRKGQWWQSFASATKK